MEVTKDPATPERIVQRVAGGETLKEIAKAWGIPPTRFLAWVAGQADLTEQCKRVMQLAGIELRLEGLEIVDDVKDAETSEEIAAAKLRAEYRERLSRDFNRSLFGKTTQHNHTHTIDLGDRLRRARERVVFDQPAQVSQAGDLLSASVGVTSTDGIGAPEPAAPRQDIDTAESRQPTHEPQLI